MFYGIQRGTGRRGGNRNESCGEDDAEEVLINELFSLVMMILPILTVEVSGSKYSEKIKSISYPTVTRTLYL